MWLKFRELEVESIKVMLEGSIYQAGHLEGPNSSLF